MISDKVIKRAIEYIWRQNPPANIDSEGLEIMHALMARITELCGGMPPEDDVPEDKPPEKEEPVEYKQPMKMIKGQSRMEF